MITPNLHASRKMKMTPVGEIPVEWGIIRFGELVESSQYGVSLGSVPYGQTPILRMNNINGGEVNLSNLAYVSADREELKASLLTEGDLLFNRTNSLELVGKTAIFNKPGIFTFASYIVRFRVDELKADPYFVNYFFNMPASRQRLRLLAAVGVSQCNINPTILQKYFLVPLPPPSEQRKITEILDTWDRAIERLGKLIAAKKRLKHGLMQQLLNGKKRFGEFTEHGWKRMKVGDFTRPAVRVVTKPTESFKALGIRSHGKGTFLKRDFNPATIEMTELYVVRESDLIVNITFAWEGAIAIVGAADDGALVSHRFPTYEFLTDRVIPDYFRHVILQRAFVLRLGLISPGGAGRNRVLSKHDFAKLELAIPSLPEQRRIANVLNGCDREIQLLQTELSALQNQKKGLMQKLLTGKVRVTHLLTEST